MQADITTTGQQTYADDVSLGTAPASAASPPAADFNGNLSVGTHDLRLLTDALTIANTIATGDSSRQASIATLTDGRSIGLAGGAGNLALSQALTQPLWQLCEPHRGSQHQQQHHHVLDLL